MRYSLKPQLRTLGPKYGKQLKAISAFLATCNAGEVVKAVRETGVYTVDLGGEVVLTEEDLQIFTEAAEGYVSAADRGITVALDTRLTEELLAEGTERELVSKIQSLRKEAGFEVPDRIVVAYEAAEGRAKTALAKGAFASDVLAVKIFEGAQDGYCKEVDVNGEKVKLTVKKN